MAGASGSRSPDVANLEIRKAAIEDEVFHKILHYWEELQRLKLIYEAGEVYTFNLMARMDKFRDRLRLSAWSDVFTDDHVHELLLRKEKEYLRKMTSSASYLKTSAGLRGWMILWMAFVEEEYHNVVRKNLLK